jgi:hypothetical protein
MSSSAAARCSRGGAYFGKGRRRADAATEIGLALGGAFDDSLAALSSWVREVVDGTKAGPRAHQAVVAGRCIHR